MADSAVTLAERRWEAARNLRWRYDWHWETCIRKHAGQHWITWDLNEQRLVLQKPRRKDMELRRTNLIRRHYRVLKSLMKRSYPRPVCAPGPGPGTNEEKRIAVDIGNGLIDAWWDDVLHMEQTLNQIIGSCLVIGNAYQSSGWDENDARRSFEKQVDPQAVEKMQDKPVYHCDSCDGTYTLDMEPGMQMSCGACGAPVHESQIFMQPMPYTDYEIPMDKAGMPMMETVTEGEVSAPFVSALELFPGRRARDLRSAGYMFRLRYLPKSAVKSFTGEDVDEKRLVTAEIRDYHLYDWVVNGITGSVNDYGYDDSGDHEASDLCVFLEYMVQPNPSEPNGLYHIYGDMSAKETSLIKESTYKETFSHTDLPFGLVHYQYEQVPGRYHGAGMVEDMYPINDQFNAESTQMDYMRSRYLYSKWVLFEDSDIHPNQLTSDNDVIRATDKDSAPILINPAVPIPQLAQAQAMTYGRAKDMSGVEQPLAGQQPGSIRTTGGINQISEFAMMPIMEVVADMAKNTRDLFGSLINTAQQKYEDDRVIDILGTASGEEWAVFKAADFKKPGLVVRVETDHLWPMTREQKRDGIMGLIQYTQGAFMQFVMSDPQMTSEILDLFGLNKKTFNALYNRATRHSELELQRFLKNPDPQVNPIMMDPEVDHHQFHAMHNDQWLTTQGLQYRFSPEPQKRMIYDHVRQHMMTHKQAHQQQQLMQMMAMQQAQGGGQAPRPQPKSSPQSRESKAGGAA